MRLFRSRETPHRSSSACVFFFYYLKSALKTVKYDIHCQCPPAVNKHVALSAASFSLTSVQWRFLPEFNVWSEILTFPGLAFKPAANSNDDKAETHFHYCSQQQLCCLASSIFNAENMMWAFLFFNHTVLLSFTFLCFQKQFGTFFSPAYMIHFLVCEHLCK